MFIILVLFFTFYGFKESKIKWKQQLGRLVKVTDFYSSISFIWIFWIGLGRGIKKSPLKLVLLHKIENDFTPKNVRFLLWKYFSCPPLIFFPISKITTDNFYRLSFLFIKCLALNSMWSMGKAIYSSFDYSKGSDIIKI